MKSDDRVSARLPAVADSDESIFLEADEGWRVWTVEREDPISEDELSALVERTRAPVLCAYVMDSDCAVIEALGVRTGFWRTCLGREAMAAYMAESDADFEAWFAPAEQSTRSALGWAADAGCDPSETTLSEVLTASPAPFVEPIFLDLLKGMGIRPSSHS
ncbi:hypothetical protein ACFVT5_35580 [Streptomyces sp. NPDC058001]|uniref:hypothetical protein n=1 Tax=Streptomyces sp. NPDC058001 TaxID=3346300 RepID=UPI0036EDCF65